MFKRLWSGLTWIFTQPGKLLFKAPLFSGAVLIINLICYWLAGKAVFEWFEFFWIDPVLIDLNQIVLPGLRFFPELHREFGSPLLDLLRPVLLMAAWQAAFAVSTLFTGPLLTSFSRKLEGHTGLQPADQKPSWYFYPGQELLLLCWTITWSVILIPGTVYGSTAVRFIHQLLFYLITPLLYGTIQLSYPLLDRGLSYSNILRCGTKRFLFFYGFSWAIFAGFLIISRLSTAVQLTGLSAAFLFMLNALIRPPAVLSAVQISSRWQPLPEPRPAGKLLKCAHATAVIITVAALFTLIQLRENTRSKLNLLKTDWSGFRIYWKKNFSLTELLSGTAQPAFQLDITVSNGSARRITLEGIKIRLFNGQKPLLSADINAITVSAFQRKQLKTQLKLHTRRILPALIKREIGPLHLKGYITLPLWFGTINWPLWW